MPTIEESNALAQRFMLAAHLLRAAIDEVDQAGKQGETFVEREPEAADTAVLEGENIVRALRTLAIRLDRAALIKFEPSAVILNLLRTAVDAWEAGNRRTAIEDGVDQAIIRLPMAWIEKASAF